eukprot:g3550.t1
MPFRPKFCGGKTIDESNPHNKAKQLIAEKNKEKTNAPIYQNKQIVLKKSANRARPSSAPNRRRGPAKRATVPGDDKQKKILKPLSKNADERKSYNPSEIRRRLQDSLHEIKPKRQVPYMTAREAVVSQNGGSVLGNVIEQGNNSTYNDQIFEQPGVFVQGSMVVPQENVGAVTTLARRFCEEMKTRGYDYSSSQGGVNIQLLVQSGQLHRLMSALQSLDTGVTMRLTMKVQKDDSSILSLGSNSANHSFASGKEDQSKVNDQLHEPVVLWNSNKKSFSTNEAASNILRTLEGSAIKSKHKNNHSRDNSDLPRMLRNQMSPEKAAERVAYSHELKDIAQSIPAPCPVSLREVDDDTQKAVLWPTKAANKKYKEKFPSEYIKLDLQRKKKAEMITSAAFARNLSRCARLGDRKAVMAMLSQHKHNKGWVNAQCEDGTTALHHAADAGHLDIVEDLLKQGADIGIKAPLHGVPLNLAQKNLRRAIDFNKKKEIRDRCNMICCLLKNSSIHRAAQEGDVTRVKYLYEEHGIDAMVANKYGMTPLHLAAVGGHSLTARYLYQIGGEKALQARNNLGQLPVDIAIGDVVDVLEETHRLEKERQEYIVKHRKQAEDQLDKDEKKDREAWESVRGTSAAIPLKEKMLERVISRQRMSPVKYVKNKKNRKHASQAKGIFGDGKSPSKSRFMRMGKDHDTVSNARRVRRKGMFSDRAFQDRHPAQGSSRLRHVRNFCKSDDPKDVLAAFHAYDRRVKKHASGTPKVTDRNFDSWVSFHFGAVRS